MGLSRSMLGMLKSRPQWRAYTGDDQWGNNVYDEPVTIEAFIGTANLTTGNQDGQNVQETENVVTVDIITDYKGIQPKDTLTHNSVVYAVQSVETPHDQFGVPLYHQITATTRKEG